MKAYGSFTGHLTLKKKKNYNLHGQSWHSNRSTWTSESQLGTSKTRLCGNGLNLISSTGEVVKTNRLAGFKLHAVSTNMYGTHLNSGNQTTMHKDVWALTNVVFSNFVAGTRINHPMPEKSFPTNTRPQVASTDYGQVGTTCIDTGARLKTPQRPKF